MIYPGLKIFLKNRVRVFLTASKKMSGKLGPFSQKMPSTSLTSSENLAVSSQEIPSTRASQQTMPLTMYRRMFVNPPHDIRLDYSDLISMMPERFLLSNLNDIFNSWKSALDIVGGLASLPELSSQAGIKTPSFYSHDFRDYRADYYIEKYAGNALFCLKLDNSGFLYPPVNQLILFNSKISSQRHRNVFQKLDSAHKDDFGSLIAFARDYLKCRKVKFQLFYCFEGDRMDFKAFDISDPTKGVAITFENLLPLDGQFDDDYWLSDGEDDTETDERM